MKRSELAVVLFSIAYVAASVPAALRSGNAEFVFYIAVMIGLGALVWVVHRRVELTIGIGYGDDIDKARGIIRRLIDADERVIGDPEPVIAVSAAVSNT